MSADVAITGAGALGCAYAGILTAAGVDVTLLTAPDRVATLGRSGLEIHLPSGTLRVRVPAAATGSARVVLVTAKAFGTEAALARVGAPPATILSLQNGLEKNAPLIARFGTAAAGAVSTLAAALIAPGVVSVDALGQTLVGDPAAAALLSAAGIPAAFDADVRAAEWSKLAQVAATMGAQAVARRPLHEILLGEQTALLLVAIVREVAAIAAANGNGLIDRAGLLPVKSLAAADDRGARELLAERGEQLVAAGRLQVRTSMLRSLERGERTEADEIHGALVRRARALSLPHRALARALNAASAG